MDDLSRQIGYLRHYTPEYDSFTTLEDIGSGINFKRKGIQALLDRCLSGRIGTVVVAHRDRLSRFGFDLIKSIIEKAGGKIIVIDDTQGKSSEQELAEDLMSIVHIYSCRQMGKRSYSFTRNKDSQDKTETVGSTKD
jgi:predicted site-specific integrase-resolvase